MKIGFLKVVLVVCGQVVADIPEKDCEAGSVGPGGGPPSGPSRPDDQGKPESEFPGREAWRCPTCGGSSVSPGNPGESGLPDQEEEDKLLERLAENERMTERLQQEIGNLEKSLASKDQEVSKLRKEVRLVRAQSSPS